MAIKKLSAKAVAIPKFSATPGGEEGVFQLSSHARAREALDFALCAEGPGFNVFVLGPERGGRMTATVEFLEGKMAERKNRPCDWVYLNNFSAPHLPRPAQLPAGEGRKFQAKMSALLPQLRSELTKAFGAPEYERQVEEQSGQVQQQVNQEIENLRKAAREEGLDIVQSPQGFSIVPIGADGKQVTSEGMPEVQRKSLEASARELSERLRDLRRTAAQRQMTFAEQLASMNRKVAENAVAGLMEEIEGAFADNKDITAWLREMHEDILENIQRFKPAAEGQGADSGSPEMRYAVNLLVDNSACTSPPVILEPSPSAASVFGYIEYRQKGGILETDFTMVRAGALHRANGGILVLRADGLATVPDLWTKLKAALRDREIALETPERSGGIPIAGLPKPQPIALNVKVVLVGAPKWYYTFFSVDPEFQAYFRVKADVDADMEASDRNISAYAAMIHRMARNYGGRKIAKNAVSRLLGMASRWSGDRTRLSAQFERVEDALREAAHHAASSKTISLNCVEKALLSRRERNSRIEDRLHEQINEGTVMIDVTGRTLGQVNALTVRDLGDHAFGAPSRITARTSIGRRGVINLERDISLSGPIQQKGAMVVQGFLAGRFAKRFPLSFNASITFEQNYGGVEGDSASLAELIAILSELSGIPVRQDLAITGSVNQHGESQAIGGVHHKVEGFFRSCCDRGGLTGSQGVVMPKANETNLILRDEVADAVAKKRFHIWSVETIDEAAEILMDMPAGQPDRHGAFEPNTIYGRVSLELERFDRVLRAGPAEQEGF